MAMQIVNSFEKENFSFRQTSVFPISEEICKEGNLSLRENLVKGKYKSSDDYLDLHFHLLREDFVRPIREGILSIRNGQKVTRKGNGISLFENVMVTKLVMSQNTLAYQISFKHSNRNAAKSSSFLQGNFICLSKDRFETFISGYIHNSSLGNLRNDYIEVIFDEHPILNRLYDMIESAAYFLPYHYVLQALQSKKNVPLSDYVLNVTNEIIPPDYIKRKPQLSYDLNIIASTRNGKKHNFVKLNMPIEKWPNAKTFSIDASQRKALHSALTQQLAIIQGPPGTGKTFVGLKIVKTLLHNYSLIWSKKKNPPIFVISYTNHALDQFLEGMVPFTTKIVRVGSRSESEILKKFQVREVRYNHRKQFRDSHFYSNFFYERAVLNEYDKQIAALNSELKHLRNPKGVLKFEILAHHMPVHIAQLLNIFGLSNWLLDTCAVNDQNYFLKENQSFYYKSDVEMLSDSFCQHAISEKENDNWDELQKYKDLKEKNRNLDLGAEDFKNEKNKIPDQVYYEFDLESLEIHFQLLCNILQNGNNDNLIVSLHHQVRLQLHIAKSLIKMPNPMQHYSGENLDILMLSTHDRWILYHAWVSKRIDEIERALSLSSQEYAKQFNVYSDLWDQEMIQLMNKSSVVGITTTGAAKLNKIIQKVGPAIVVIEEAAEILESHVVTSLASNCQHLILIGDHQQLRPSTNVHELAVTHKLDVSLFERLIDNGVRFATLTDQHRMRPNISKLIVPSIYPELRDSLSVHGRDHIKGMDKDVFFIDHSHHENVVFQENTSHSNVFEAKFLMALCSHLILQGYSPAKITILTAYSGQLNLMIKYQKMDPMCSSVRICTVDSFQGEENDIILLSLVRNNDEGNVGFLKVSNRVCVALSRARNGFYIMGNMNQLCSKSNLWRNIRQTLRSDHSIGPSLPVKCFIHPEQNFKASEPSCFRNKSPFGGCRLECSFVYKDCNHPCDRMCHIVDMDHQQNFLCRKPCERTSCNYKHACPKKCGDACGPCNKYVKKTLPCQHQALVSCSKSENVVKSLKCTVLVEKINNSCNHFNTVECSQDVHKISCIATCNTELACGHRCKKQCHHKDTDLDHESYKCLVIVKKWLILNCNHVYRDIKCYENIQDIKCKQQCQKTLLCGHQCQQKCSEACNCQERVEKKIESCGHKLMTLCSQTPLQHQCMKICEKELSCGHTCPNLCKDDCSTKCMELVPSKQCPKGHSVSVPCFQKSTILNELADLLCLSDCDELLPCNHKCEGKCGLCLTGRLHAPCQQRCQRILICGHVCQSKCSIECQPCIEGCYKRCEHGRCLQKCSMQCSPCQKSCTWKCTHEVCTKSCGSECSRDPCYYDCPEILPCGHFCIGFCGDPCPALCRICDERELLLVHQGAKDLRTRFVSLEDCQHVVEVKDLERLLQNSNQEVGFPMCPKCDKTIWNLRRYQFLIQSRAVLVKSAQAKYFTSTNFHTISEDILTTIYDMVNASERNAYRKELLQIQNVVEKAKNNFFYHTSQLNDLNITLFQVRVLKKCSDMLNQFSCDKMLVKSLLRNLISKVTSYSSRTSRLLMENLDCELQRICYLIELKLLPDDSNFRTQALVKLNLVKRFDAEAEREMDSFLLQSGLSISFARLIIPQSTSYERGHWLVCSKGHVYSISTGCMFCNASVKSFKSRELIVDNALQLDNIYNT